MESKYCDVSGSAVHYLEEGSGEPILFLHGNPTSSYLWRNVVPHLSKQGRCIALDLIGMGKSDKPDIEYRFQDHYRYVLGFIEAMGLKDITLVLHDWGSALGFHYAANNSGNVKAIAFMEAIVKTMRWRDMSTEHKTLFKMLRMPFVGWGMLSVYNIFVNKILPQMTLRQLGQEEIAIYNQPFPSIVSRKPIRAWPQEIPIDGNPADVHDVVTKYVEYLQKSEVSKLLLYADPGVIITSEVVKWCEGSFKNLDSVSVGKGLHYIQEDEPDAIGKAISGWLASLSSEKAA